MQGCKAKLQDQGFSAKELDFLEQQADILVSGQVWICKLTVFGTSILLASCFGIDSSSHGRFVIR